MAICDACGREVYRSENGHVLVQNERFTACPDCRDKVLAIFQGET